MANSKENQMVPQGKIVAEPDGLGWLVSFPDGYVQWFASKRSAENASREFFKKDFRSKNASSGIGEIEWRENA
jgi:hypothetical protein